VARRHIFRDVALIVLSIVVIIMLMREAYDKGTEDGYWEAIETDLNCELWAKN
jgi:hypothetical protein